MGKRGPQKTGVSWRDGGVSVINSVGQMGQGSNNDTEDDAELGTLKTALFHRIAQERGEKELLAFLVLNAQGRLDYCRQHGIMLEWLALQSYLLNGIC